MAKLSDYRKQVVDSLGHIADNTSNLGTIKTPSKKPDTAQESLSQLTVLSGLIATLLGGKNAGNKIMSSPNNATAVINACQYGIFSKIDSLLEAIQSQSNDGAAATMNSKDVGDSVNMSKNPADMTVLLRADGEGAERFLDMLKDYSVIDNMNQSISTMSMLIDSIGNMDIRSAAGNISGIIPEIAEFAKALDVEHPVSNISDEAEKMISVIESFSKAFSEADFSDVQKKVESLIKIIGADAKKGDKSINKLFSLINENFGDLKITNENIANIEPAIKSVGHVMYALNNLSNVNEKNLNNIETVLRKSENLLYSEDEKKTTLFSLLKVLSNASGEELGKIDEKTIASKLKIVDSLFGSIESAGQINPVKALLNVKFTKKFLTADVTEVANTLIETSKEIDPQKSKNVKAAFDVFSAFMESLTKVVIWDKNQRKSVKDNIEFISDSIVHSVNAIIESLASASENVNTEGLKHLKHINDFFEAISNIGNFSFKDLLISIPLKTSLINEVITSSIQSLVDDLNNLNVSEKTKEMISILDDFFAFYSRMDDSIPGPIKSAYLGISLSLIESLVNNALREIMKSIPQKASILSSAERIDSIEKMFIPALTAMFDSVSQLNSKNYSESLNNVSKDIDVVIGAMKKIERIKDDLKELKRIAKELSTIGTLKFDKGINALINIASNLRVVVSKFAEIDNSDLEKTIDAVKNLSMLVMLSASILVFGALTMAFINPISLVVFALTLLEFTGSLIAIYTFFSKFLKSTISSAKQFMYLVSMSAAVLVLGSISMHLINPADLMLFTTVLGVFVFAMTGMYVLASIFSKQALNGLRDFTLLVLASGGVLMLGALFMKVLNIGDIILFCTMLTGFVALLTTVYIIASRSIKQAITGMTQFTYLVLATGGILVLGSLVTRYVKLQDMIAFVGMTFLLIAGTVTIFAVFSKKLTDALKDAAKLAVLIGICGGILLLSALVVKDLKTVMMVMLFAAVLGVFVWAIASTFAHYSSEIRMALPAAYALGLLVLVCGAILLLAGKILDWDEYLKVLAFAATLAIFVGALCWVFSRWGKELDKALPGMYALALIVLIGGGVLIAAGTMLSEDDMVTVFWFAVTLTGMIAAMGAIAIWLDKRKDKIWGGVAVMAAISAIIFISALAFAKLGETARLIDQSCGLSTFAIVVAIFVGVLVTLATAVTIIAQFLATPMVMAGAAIAIGIIVAVAGAIWIISEAMLNVVEAMERMAAMPKIDGNIIKKNIGAILEVTTALSVLILQGPIIIAASVVISSLSVALGMMAKAVRDYAELKVPVYEGTKLVGYRSLTRRDFSEASKNIALIVTTLGNAVIEAYKGNEDMFNPGFMQTQSPFAKVCKSLEKLAPLISSIAKSVKEYAELKVPIYEGTKVVGYRPLDKNDFKNASKNVKIIMTTLGKAVIDVYNGDFDGSGSNNNKEEARAMFDNFWGDSPFVRVVKANTLLAGMISKISKSVKEYADLKIPLFEGTKLVGYKPLDREDFQNAADNVKIIMTTLGKAIIDVYNGKFDGTDIDMKPEDVRAMYDNFWGDSPFTKVLKANSLLGNMISKIAQGVKDYASLTVPMYDEATHEVLKDQVRVLTQDDFTNASNNIALVLSTLGGAIMKEYDEHTEWYEGAWYQSSSPFKKVIDTNAKLAELISKVGKAIKDYATFTDGLPTGISTIAGENGKSYIKYDDDNIFYQAGLNIKKILTFIGEAVVDVANKPIIKENKKAIDTVTKMFDGVCKAIVPAVQATKDLAVLEIVDPATGEKRSLTPAEIGQAAENVGTILKGLGGAIMEVVTDPNNSKIFGKSKGWFSGSVKEDEIPAIVAAKSIGLIADPISKIAKVIHIFANGETIERKYDAKGNVVSETVNKAPNFENAKANIKTILTCLGAAISDVYNENKKIFALDDNGKTIASKVISCVSDVVKLLNTVINEIKTFDDTEKNSGINGSTIRTIVDDVEKMFGGDDGTGGLVKIISLLNSISTDKAALELLENESTLSDIVTASETVTCSIIEMFSSIKSDIEELGSVDLSENGEIMKSLNGLITIIDAINSTSIAAQEKSSILDNVFHLLKSSATNANVDAITKYAEDINRIVEVAEYSKGTGDEGYEYVSKGIREVDESISKISDTSKFAQHTSVLEKYVRTVNSINMSRVDKLINMTNSMNYLAFKLGNIDDLTKVLAENMTEVLSKLSEELAVSRDTIERAEEIQAKRHKLIEKSISSVKKIMNDPLRIEITNVDDSTDLFTPSSPSGGTPGRTSVVDSSTPDLGSSPSTAPKGVSEEDKSAPNGDAPANYTYNPTNIDMLELAREITALLPKQKNNTLNS